MDKKRFGALITMLALSGAGLLLVFLLLDRSAVGAAAGRGIAITGIQSPSASFTVSGTVTCEVTGPISDVDAFVWNRDKGSGFVGDTTDSSGYYSVTLEGGNYDLIFNPPCGSGCASQSLKGITGPSDQTRNVTLTLGHSVSGTVFATDGTTPVGNVAICAFNHDTANGFGLPPTDADGHYCIGLVEGPYDLSFTPPPCLGLGPKTEVITVTQDITRDVVLTSGFTVAGCITDGAGNPVPGVQIYAYDPAIRGFGFTPSDESGCYTGTLPLGTFDIQFIPPAGRGLGSITVIDVVSETAGCPSTSLPITLPAGSTISGGVTCLGEPVKNAYVYADPVGEPAPGDDLVGWGLYTVDDGSYELPLVSGTYRLEFIPPSAARLNAKAFTTVELITDTVLNVDFCLCSGVWITETVDSAGNAGGGTSLALEPTYPHTPHISYRDAASDGLKHAWLSGTTWLSETVDSGCGPTSLALMPTYPYTPCISYDGCSRRLKFSWLEGTTWISNTVPGIDACCSSLALEPTYPYTPHISYHWAWDAATLYHAHLSGTAWMSGTWVREPVEPHGSNVGWWSSLALEPNYPYVPHISYYDSTNDDSKHAWLSGTVWLSETVDSAGNVGAFTSLALNSSGNPHVSYLDLTNDALKYAWLSDTTWLSETVDSTGQPPYNRGRSSLELDQADAIYISYYDATNGDLKFAHFGGTVWIIQTVDRGGEVGQYSSLALDQAGCPHISYYDATNGDLKYAYLPAAVQAGFTASPTTGIAPLTVTFTNASVGDYTTSLWEFGDGVTSTLESPTHTYTAKGVYTVALTVSGPGGGDTETKTEYIKVDYGIYLPIIMKTYSQP